MRTWLFPVVALVGLGAAPAHAALLKTKPCAMPRQCATLKKAVTACKSGGRCTALVSALTALEPPTACQRTQAADNHAFSLCGKDVQDEAFARLSHADSTPARRYFCSPHFKRLLARRNSLKEQYTYAYAPYDPNSEDDEIGAERPDFFATMTDCTKLPHSKASKP